MTTVRVVYQAPRCLVDDGGCARNVASALARGLPVVTRQPARKDRLAIVAAGPSAGDHLDELRNWGGQIWAINGAFCWLIGEGITPDAFVAVDPGKGVEQVLTERPESATYYLAAICDPGLYEHLQDRNVKVWCSIHNDIRYPDGTAIVPGGTTCLTRAPFLALEEGYRDITVFGGDSSFRERVYCYDEQRYACSVPPDVCTVKVGDKFFLTCPQMVQQVSTLGAMAELFGDKLKFRADGLLKAWLDEPIMNIKVEKAA